MRSGGPRGPALALLVGSGAGSGIALLFLLVGILGAAACLIQMGSRAYASLEE